MNDNSVLRLIIATALIILMAGLMHLAPVMAYGPGTASYTHWVYMFAHGSWLHWAVNSYMLLLFHHVMHAHRTIAAYIASVLVTYIYTPDIPVVGISTMILFIVGYMIPYKIRKYGIATLAILAIILLVGMIVQEFAGAYHLMCTALGLIYYYAEGFVRRTYDYVTND